VSDVRRVDPTPETLEAYASVSSAFDVSARYDVPALLEGHFLAHPVPAVTKELEDPRRWQRYGLALWGLFLAYDDANPVGACAISRGVDSLYFDTAPGDALLWDIRVSHVYRGSRIGKTLLREAIAWARDAGIEALLIETQDTNVAACALYASAGAAIVDTRRGAYVEWPDEVLIVWRIDLS